MIRLALVAFFLSIGMFYMAQKEFTLAAAASEQAEEMTLAALIERGPEGNTHVIISDFDGAGDIVYEEKRGTWSKVWVPITPFEKADVPLDGQVPKRAKPNQVRALMYSTQLHSEQEVSQAVMKDKIQGMVINQIESLGSKERKLLQDSYPGTDFGRCIIFELDRKPGSGVIYLGVGVAAIVTGVVLLIVRFRQRSS